VINRAPDSIIEMAKALWAHRRTTVLLLAWGTIFGINWTFGALFGIIFSEQHLTGKEIALIGLAANLSTAFFSNLGTFIKNRFNLENISIIQYLNMAGIVASVIIQLSRFVGVFQNLYFLVFIIIILRAGFSSFVSLAFIEMKKEGIKELIISAFFFWVANLVNLLSMELVDLLPTDLSLFMVTGSVCACTLLVHFYERYR
jgi:hypothetical protein